MEVARQDLRAVESRAAITYITEVPLSEMLAAVAALRDDALVLFVTMSLDGDGVARTGPEVLAALRSAATVPDLRHVEDFLGHGIVGGVMVDLERHGMDLGQRAHQIPRRRQAADLAPMVSLNLVAFDGRELKRFGIDEAWLPPGATVANREVSLWGAYKRTILVVVALLVSQALLIGALFVQGQTRRRAEVALHHLSGRLLSAQEEERRRIARELHDNLSQQVALLAIEIEQLAMKSGGPPAAVARSMRQLGERTAEISTEIHNSRHRLHSAKLEALGLVAAVRGHCHELLAHGVQVHFSDDNVPGSVSRRCGALPVPHRPGRAEQCRQAQRRPRGACDAQRRRETRSCSASRTSAAGSTRRRAANRDGLGLASMRERLRLIGGELTIRSRAGQGTTIDARVPLLAQAARRPPTRYRWRIMHGRA